jgi:hypothetical protein
MARSVRYRFHVPVTDKAVIAWLSMQGDASASIRAVIKEAISSHGYGDMFASELPDGMVVDVDGDSVSVTYDEAAQTQAPKSAPSSAPTPKAGVVMDDSVIDDFDDISEMMNG